MDFKLKVFFLTMLALAASGSAAERKPQSEADRFANGALCVTGLLVDSVSGATGAGDGAGAVDAPRSMSSSSGGLVAILGFGRPLGLPKLLSDACLIDSLEDSEGFKKLKFRPYTDFTEIYESDINKQMMILISPYHPEIIKTQQDGMPAKILDAGFEKLQMCKLDEHNYLLKIKANDDLKQYELWHINNEIEGVKMVSIFATLRKGDTIRYNYTTGILGLCFNRRYIPNLYFVKQEGNKFFKICWKTLWKQSGLIDG